MSKTLIILKLVIVTLLATSAYSFASQECLQTYKDDEPVCLTAWGVNGHYVVTLPKSVGNLAQPRVAVWRQQEAWPFHFEHRAGIVVYIVKNKEPDSEDIPLLVKTAALFADKVARASGGAKYIIETFEKERRDGP